MVNIIIIAIIAIGVIGGIRHMKKVSEAGCCGTDGGSDKKIKVADKDPSHYPYKTELICDDMHCKNCVTHVDNALNKMDGTWANADLETKKVTILSKNKPDVASYQRALNQAGYPAHLA